MDGSIRRAGYACWAIVATLLLGACGGGGNGGGSGEAPYGLDSRVAVAGLRFPDSGVQAGQLSLVPAFADLPAFDLPIAVAPVPGQARLGVATQGGRLYEFDARADATASRLVLDLSDRTRADGEQGLLGLAYDPDYAGNGWVYLYYSDLRSADPGPSVIARFRANPATGVIDRASETRLLSFAQPYANHNGGALAFGQDGKLYIASGDGGSANDPQDNAQNLGVLLGKILRIEPDGGIPADNPFVGTAGARGEIWAYGLRNPFRISVDAASGRLWAGDVGQGAQEEVDVITRGGNYGWPLYEGTRSNKNPSNRPASDFIAPVHTYGRGDGVSITGGAVYRGSLPELAGYYVYGDFGSGAVWALREAGGVAAENIAIGTIAGPSSFASDASGELLITAYGDGRLYKLARAGSGGTEFPRLLSQTGLFADLASLRTAPGLIEYAVNAPFWSDGTRKRRWLALPGTQRIGFSADGAWSFPVGSVIVKHFDIRLADGRDQRLETRVLIHQSRNGWQGYTYRWNEAGSDAELLDAGASVRLSVADAASPGGVREQVYEFPSRGDCLRCHTGAAGSVLGLRTAQMNRSFAYGTVSDNQLRAFDHIELFDRRIGDAAQYAALADPADASKTLASRARAYLDSNCAQCHRPGGPTPTDLDLRAGVANAAMNTHGVAPTGGDLGIAGAQRIAPGDKSRSLVWERMRRLDSSRMPPLSSHVVDAAGVELIGAWIDAGAAAP